MLKLMNLSTHEMDLKRFEHLPEGLAAFLANHQLQGVEVIQYGQWDETLLSKKHIVGFHMKFWPIWLDFWNGNEKALLKEFDNHETIERYYGGNSPKTLVSQYRDELMTAASMGASYAVFHVSHVSLRNCYDYDFDHDHEPIIDAFIELMNEVLSEELVLPEGFKILLENQWWPGLTLQHPLLAEKLVKGIRYPHVGFMLDIGHLMNANLSLRTESEAVDYILRNLEDLGSARHLIKGVHLSSSLSGEYLEQALQDTALYDETLPFYERYYNAFGHIGQIDRHQVFENPRINEVIHLVNPEFLVLEFMTGTFEEAENMISRQRAVLECFNQAL